MTERLRICLIASSRFPVREPFMGGLEAHTHALAGALKRRGHQVSLFAAPGSDPALGVTSLPRADFTSSPAARADVASSPQAWMQEHHAYLDLMLGVAHGRHGPFDVIHNNSLHHLPIAMSRVVDVPIVTTLHTPPVEWLESAAAFAAPPSRFIAVSDWVSRAWSHVVASTTIHNGVDTRFWCPGPGEGGAIWSGRLVPEKAPHEAIDAAVRAEIEIRLAGPVHDPAYFRREIEPRLGRGVRYLGHLDRDDLRRAVGAASVAVVTPDWDEPFGLVAAEAMSCGTPVAAYDRGALHEIVDDESGVLVPAGDVDALAAALTSATRLDRHGVRRRARRYFSLDTMVEGYEATYVQMTGLAGAA